MVSHAIALSIFALAFGALVMLAYVVRRKRITKIAWTLILLPGTIMALVMVGPGVPCILENYHDETYLCEGDKVTEMDRAHHGLQGRKGVIRFEKYPLKQSGRLTVYFGAQKRSVEYVETAHRVWTSRLRCTDPKKKRVKKP